MDESCQGLDEEHRAQVLQLIQKIAEFTVCQLLYVTHHPSEILPAFTHHLELVQNPHGPATPRIHHLQSKGLT